MFVVTTLLFIATSGHSCHLTQGHLLKVQNDEEAQESSYSYVKSSPSFVEDLEHRNDVSKGRRWIMSQKKGGQ